MIWIVALDWYYYSLVSINYFQAIYFLNYNKYESLHIINWFSLGVLYKHKALFLYNNILSEYISR